MKLAVLVGITLLTASVLAVELVVEKGGDDTGNCVLAPCATLRYALTKSTNTDTILLGKGTFDAGAEDGPALVGQDVDITIKGEGIGDTTIDFGDLDSEFARGFYMQQGHTLHLEDLTVKDTTPFLDSDGDRDNQFSAKNIHIINSRAQRDGGCIFYPDDLRTELVLENVEMENCILDDAGVGERGAAIYLARPATFTNVKINGATGAKQGGGIFIDGVTLTLEEGGLEIYDAVASEYGGALYMTDDAIITGKLTIGGSTSGRHGGSIWALDGSSILGLSADSRIFGGIASSEKYDDLGEYEGAQNVACTHEFETGGPSPSLEGCVTCGGCFGGYCLVNTSSVEEIEQATENNCVCGSNAGGGADCPCPSGEVYLPDKHKCGCPDGTIAYFGCLPTAVGVTAVAVSAGVLLGGVGFFVWKRKQ